MNKLTHEQILFNKFQEEEIPTQITLGIGELPTVHALHKGSLYKTEEDTVLQALLKMRDKLGVN